METFEKEQKKAIDDINKSSRLTYKMDTETKGCIGCCVIIAIICLGVAVPLVIALWKWALR